MAETFLLQPALTVTVKLLISLHVTNSTAFNIIASSSTSVLSFASGLHKADRDDVLMKNCFRVRPVSSHRTTLISSVCDNLGEGAKMRLLSVGHVGLGESD